MTQQDTSTPIGHLLSWWKGLALLFASVLLIGGQAWATTCANATGLAHQNYTNQAVTCGSSNDITGSNAASCGSGSYKGGNEALYKFTATAGGSATLAYSGQTWSSISFYAGCPTSGGTCIGSVANSTSSKSINVNIQAGVEYYFMFDTWPTPNSPCPGTFTLTLPAPPPCSGTPTPGNTTGPASACSGNNFAVGTQNPTAGTGVTYQWQTSPDGSAWSNASGASTNATYTTNQTTATWYRVQVTCSGNTGTSNPFQVGMLSSPGLCNTYCIPAMSTGCGFDYITNVNIAGINRNSACDNASGANGFSLFTSPVGSLVAGTSGNSYSVSTGGDTEGAAAWIDWNQDGQFTAGELIFTGYAGSNPATYSGNFAVPPTALSGQTRMRVRCQYSTAPAAGGACSGATWGETEDYLIDIIANTACSATPTPGNTTGPANICAGTSFTLNVANPSVEGGLTYQWETSSNGTTWTNGPGASTSPTYTTTQTAATWYRVQVTCTGNGTASSTPLQVGMTAPMICNMCFPTFTSNIEPICNVTFAGINNNSPGTVGGAPAVEDFTNLVANVAPGATYPISVTGNADGPYDNYFTAFFDLDQNGTLETVIPIGSFTGTGSSCGAPVVGSITIPSNALVGTSRMRIIKNYNSSPSAPCGSYSFGQAEDYTLNVSVPTCPTPVVSITSIIGGTATLAWTNNGADSYNWEMRTSGAPGSPGAMASGNVASGPVSVSGLSVGGSYTFYLQAICDGGNDVGFWNPTSIVLAYCAAGATANSTNIKIKQVAFADVDNPSFTTGGYDDFTSVVGNLQAGANYPISIGVSEGYDSDRIRVWIDLNQDYVFSENEKVAVLANPPGNSGPNDYTVSTSFHVASSAIAGPTRMRVRLDNTINGPQESPCGNSLFGQVEDYTVNITPAPCLAPTASTTITADCGNFQFSVDVHVTDLGDGTSITVTDNQGSPAQTGGVGTFNFGPYFNGTQVTYLVSFGPEPLCDTYVTTTYTCTPTNQSCATAQALTVYPENACVATNGSTYNASMESMTGSGCVNNVLSLPTVYYSFVATGYANNLSLNFPSGGSFNASVFTACGGTEIYCSGFTSGNFLLAGLTSGNTYIVRVASTDVGNFTLCVSESSAQPSTNDNCATAQSVGVSAYGSCSPTIGNLLGATYSGQANPGCVNQTLGVNDVYFSFTANVDRHIITMSQDSTSRVYMMGVYAGCGGTQLLCKLIGPGFDALGTEYALTGLTPGSTYIIRVLSRPAEAGPFALCVMNPPPATEVDCGGPMVNDTYTASANDNQQWAYHSNGTGDFTLTFNSGNIESFTWDKLRIYDGTNASAPVLYQNPGSTTNLAGVTVTATGSDLFMTLTTDGSNQPTLDWTVQCAYHPDLPCDANPVTCGVTYPGLSTG
ncbi:MAG: hypothetical protein KF843_14610, partial [Flavobacteriales bacterium]|nr:hypothetical protein [Flavobacteriales bacterium]